jgi:hypothetical protein
LDVGFEKGFFSLLPLGEGPGMRAYDAESLTLGRVREK